MVRPALYLRLSQRRLRRARYRVRQFIQGLQAHVTDAERRQVAAILPAAARPIFARMPLDAQRHSLNVLHALQAAGTVDHDLAVAALLHDAGKVAPNGIRLGLWARGPLVLAETLFPALVHRIAEPVPSHRLRYAVYVHTQHAYLGARQAEAAGCGPLACWLIEHHQDRTLPAHATAEQTRLLTRLQRADSRN
jgi:hypothetical protein